MSPTSQLKILNLCKGMSIKQAEYRLQVAERYTANKILDKRIRLFGLTIGD